MPFINYYIIKTIYHDNQPQLRDFKSHCYNLSTLRPRNVVDIRKLPLTCVVGTEAKYKEKHVVWDSMPELAIIPPYIDSRVDSNTFTMNNAMPESTLSPSQGVLESGLRYVDESCVKDA